eukprot:943691_1
MERATSNTKLNDISSRSHAIFIIIVEQNEITIEQDDMSSSSGKTNSPSRQTEAGLRQNFKVGKLNLVDLAGSERIRVSGATGQRLEESIKINQSLSALGNVIAALTDTKRRVHIPYRDSKLTRILEDSLGGNCITTVMAMISPALESFLESVSTLKFANRAKNIQTRPQVNEDLDEKTLLRRYERELKRLRRELIERTKNVVDKRRLIEVEEQRNRAERDKMAAIIDLERLSRDLMYEKAQKKRLQERIKEMSSQLIYGSRNTSLEDTAEFRSALSKEQKRMQREYHKKIEMLESERNGLEENKAQVDRYKQLLIKQRDIMIQLTARLNERDQSILALQEELDTYDKQQHLMEDALEQKTAALLKMQKSSIEQTDGVLSIEQPVDTDSGDVKHPETPVASSSKDRYAPHSEKHVTSSPVAYSKKSSAAPDIPVELTTDANGQISGDSAQSAPKTLSASQKITELLRIVRSKDQEQKSLAQELEEVQAEKVSLETMFRDRLDAMAHSQAEERVKRYRTELERWKKNYASLEQKISIEQKSLEKGRSGRGRDVKVFEREHKVFSEEISNLKHQLSHKDQLLKSAQEQLTAIQHKTDSEGPENKQEHHTYKARVAELQGALVREKNAMQKQEQTFKKELAVIQEKYRAKVHERAALRTILESKMKALVDSIVGATCARERAEGVSQRTLRELQILQRIVNASVTALKM